MNMKKVSLSLKKKVVSNNQQAVTSVIENASSKRKHSTQESDEEIKNYKRKAMSPLKEEFTNKHKLNPYDNKSNVSQIDNEARTCHKSNKIIRNGSNKKATYENNENLCTNSVLSENRLQKSENNLESMNGSTAKQLEIGNNETNDLFDDDWDLDFVEDALEDLDLNTMQRCEIISITKHPQKLELNLKNSFNNKGTCFVEGNWLSTPLQTGEIISISASKDSSGYFTVNNVQGLLVLRPDHLISSTSVVSGVFCRRKAVLQERWKGIDSANVAMTMGILIHELVQTALTNNISNISDLKNETNKIIKDSIERLYDTGISEQEACSNMQVYIGPLAEFMQTYVVNKSTKNVKGKWNGKIEKVLDIEENVCCPQLGLKGKIDATLQVTIHNKTGPRVTSVPLELKSGRASGSAEHTGQLVLYGMMLSALREEHPARGPQPGLLLYLKDKIDLREISRDYPERRDLIILRNELAQHLAPSPTEVKLKDIEDLSEYHQSLPEPVHHHSACSKCPYLTLCSLHLWNTNGDRVSEEHPLAKLKESALGHLSPEHIQYFLHWSSLIRMEERTQTSSPLHALWTDSWETRSKRGSCAPNLLLKRVTSTGDRHLHEFVRSDTDSEMLNKHIKGPQEGDFSIVSLEKRPWIAAGVVTLSNHTEMHILLERDLSRQLSKSTSYFIDTYESQSTTVHNLTNMGLLMEDNCVASRLRKLIIDKERPELAKKLSLNLDEDCRKLLRSLNMEQQTAIIRVLRSNDYMLLQGLPGTGKTHTLCVLVCVCVSLGRRVLVTAHTHSAVDTLLGRLPSSLRVFRVGGSRGSSTAAHQHCSSVEQLTKLYESMQVVGVTCLGASHSLLTKTEFDICIVDEATQVLQSTVLRPLFAARQFVLVGDPDQLPPVVRSRTAKKCGMEVSLFHRLMDCASTHTLSLQYRMNQPLVEVANRVAYDNRLRCANDDVAKASLNVDIQILSKHSSANPWLVTACSPKPEDAAIFLDTKLQSHDNEDQRTLTNRDEACVVLALIDALKESGVMPSDIGVIAPYRDQVAFLRRTLAGREVEVSTVDQFQGRDKSVIIYSCTRKEDSRMVKEGEVLNDKRRLAVSVTRAKHKLIVVGHLAALRSYSTLMALQEACRTVVLEGDTMAWLNKQYKTLF